MEENYIPLAAHLVSGRMLHEVMHYTHHGIYVGEGKVVHYAGLSNDPSSDGSKIQEVPLDRFQSGNDVFIRHHEFSTFTPEEIIFRARSRIGENGYSVSANNCEHFCYWAIEDRHLSNQIDERTDQVTRLGANLVRRVSEHALVKIGAAYGLYGGAGAMKAMAAVGGVVGGGVVAGIVTVGGTVAAATALAINKTILACSEGHSEDEATSRSVGRTASCVGAAGGTALSVAAITAAGVPGLSAAGITSGLASIGSVVGGGMVAGAGIAVAMPAVATVVAGVGLYKVAQNNETLRNAAASANEKLAGVVETGAEFSVEALAAATPIAEKIAGKARGLINRGASAVAATAKSAMPVGKIAAAAVTEISPMASVDIVSTARQTSEN